MTGPRPTATTPAKATPAKAAGAALVGIDVGGTKVQVVVTDLAFERLGESRGPTPGTGGPPAVVEAIHKLVVEAVDAAGNPGIAAIGVGAPGSIDRAAGIVARSPNLAGWMDPYPLGPELRRRLGAPTTVDNDVRIGMLGEHRLGAGRPFKDLLGAWFGTGVGGAVILGGELRNGRSGASGEIGHVCVVDGGRRCGCGRRGCLEAYAGRASMERRARALVRKGRHTELFRIMEKQGRDHVTSGVIARALDHGDALTHSLIDEAVAAAMQPHLFVDGEQSVQVVPAALGDYAGALGAATAAAELVAGADGRSAPRRGTR